MRTETAAERLLRLYSEVGGWLDMGEVANVFSGGNAGKAVLAEAIDEGVARISELLLRHADQESTNAAMRDRTSRYCAELVAKALGWRETEGAQGNLLLAEMLNQLGAEVQEGEGATDCLRRVIRQRRKYEDAILQAQGLYCVDRDPREADIEWIRQNAFSPFNGVVEPTTKPGGGNLDDEG